MTTIMSPSGIVTVGSLMQNVNSLIECMNYVKSVQNSNEVYEPDVEIVQLTTGVKESLQFPELEEIHDSSKSSEADEVNSTLPNSPNLSLKLIKVNTFNIPDDL